MVKFFLCQQPSIFLNTAAILFFFFFLGGAELNQFSLADITVSTILFVPTYMYTFQ